MSFSPQHRASPPKQPPKQQQQKTRRDKRQKKNAPHPSPVTPHRERPSRRSRQSRAQCFLTSSSTSETRDSKQRRISHSHLLPLSVATSPASTAAADCDLPDPRPSTALPRITPSQAKTRQASTYRAGQERPNAASAGTDRKAGWEMENIQQYVRWRTEPGARSPEHGARRTG